TTAVSDDAESRIAEARHRHESAASHHPLKHIVHSHTHSPAHPDLPLRRLPLSDADTSVISHFFLSPVGFSSTLTSSSSTSVATTRGTGEIEFVFSIHGPSYATSHSVSRVLTADGSQNMKTSPVSSASDDGLSDTAAGGVAEIYMYTVNLSIVQFFVFLVTGKCRSGSLQAAQGVAKRKDWHLKSFYQY
ncbi:calcium-dependent secretion activator 2, partial [Striga asiatica]